MVIIRSHFIVLSLISIIYFLGLTELCHFPFKIQILHDRGPLDPGDLKTFTIAAITLKEHDLIDKKQKSRKRGKFSAISLGSNRDGTSRGC